MRVIPTATKGCHCPKVLGVRYWESRLQLSFRLHIYERIRKAATVADLLRSLAHSRGGTGPNAACALYTGIISILTLGVEPWHGQTQTPRKQDIRLARIRRVE
ncbi:hypothetical protein BGX38DRAFT_1178660 [Terfezia claveryi]|nr:hypothetical protein BGX38DRAFT_1178660 [Terfezia claveryi]